MADYEVLFGARLDQASLDRAVANARTNSEFVINKFRLDTTSLTNQLQSALNNVHFNLNFNSGSSSSVVAQARQAGQQAGRALSQGISAETRASNFAKITEKINEIRSAIQGTKFKFDVGGIETLEAKLREIDYAIEKIDVSTTSKGTLKFNIRGNLGEDALRVAQEFNSAGEQIGAASIKIETAVHSSSSAINEMTAIANKTKKINFAIDTGQIESVSSRLNATYQSLATTGHTSLSQVKADLQQLAIDQQNLTNAKGGSTEQLISAYERWNASVQKVRNTLRTIKTDTQGMASSLQIQTLDSRIAQWMSKNSAASRDFGAQISSLRSRLAELNRSGSATTAELKSIEKEFLSVKNAATIAGKTGASFASSFRGALKSITRYVSASMLIYRGIAMIRQMYQNVLDVDTAMTGLYRVTNMTGEQYSNLYDGMVDSAQKYGATLKDIIDLTTSWVKLGYDAETALNLAGVTTTYQHVTDIDASTATKHLITAYKGFQDELDTSYQGNVEKSVSYVSDIYDKLNNEYAVTADDIGNAMQRSASSLSMAGNTIQQAAGMATGMNEVIQNAEKTGTVLNVTSLRLRGMKGELEDLGEEVDENVESVSQMQTHILNLTHGKVNIFKDGENFKSTYEILQEISKIWDSLSDTNQADLLETIAGKRNANGIAAIIKNWSQVESATQAATEAEGTAAAENEKFMNSMQGKVNAFKASWESLSNTLLSSDFLKGFIDGGNTLLSTLNNITKVLGEIPILVSTIYTVISARKNVGRIKLFILVNMPTVIIILFRYKQFRYYTY